MNSMNREMNCNPLLHEVIDRVCIGQYIAQFNGTKKFRCFQPQKVLKYQGYGDDFGPMNFACVAKFVQMLQKELDSHPSSKIVLLANSGRRELTNAAFLLGSYMILKLNMNVPSIVECFSWLKTYMIEAYRDATYSDPDFGLTLEDCWSGLYRGQTLGWAKLESKPGLWGKIDLDEYVHFDNPLNADLHIVVPDKFVAFRGPKELGSREYCDDRGFRVFSPKYFVEIFRVLGVTAVVRLNEVEYSHQDFTSDGIEHHDLCFEDCTFPPAHIVDRFFDIVNATPGLVAVHCKAGLGRTGTLIALHMMRCHGFTARESMGWLRIMRPGSIIGDQQRGLCAAEEHFAAPPSSRSLSAASTPPSRGGSGVDSKVLAAQVASAMERRCSSRSCTPSAGSSTLCLRPPGLASSEGLIDENLGLNS